MKIQLLILLALFAFKTSLAQRVNFSGSWTLDTKASEFGVMSVHAASFELKNKHIQDSIMIERSSKTETGELRQYTERFLINGKSNTTIRSYDGINKVTTITDILKGLKMVMHYYSSSSSQSPDHTFIENWTLSDDGNKLISLIDVLVDGQESQIKLFYNRK